LGISFDSSGAFVVPSRNLLSLQMNNCQKKSYFKVNKVVKTGKKYLSSDPTCSF
jgi:hypothetical protein